MCCIAAAVAAAVPYTIRIEFLCVLSFDFDFGKLVNSNKCFRKLIFCLKKQSNSDVEHHCMSAWPSTQRGRERERNADANRFLLLIVAYEFRSSNRLHDCHLSSQDKNERERNDWRRQNEEIDVINQHQQNREKEFEIKIETGQTVQMRLDLLRFASSHDISNTHKLSEPLIR